MTELTYAEQADEMLLMGLRLVEGLDLGGLGQLTGLVPSKASIASLAELGMIERVGTDQIRATSQGRFVLNALVAQLSQGMVPQA